MAGDPPTPASTDSPEAAAVLARAVDAILARCGDQIAVAAPLGLGKPRRPLNALYDRVESEASRRLRSHAALSLEPPAPRAGLEHVEEFYLRSGALL